jgi:hypothetical protein
MGSSVSSPATMGSALILISALKPKQRQVRSGAIASVDQAPMTSGLPRLTDMPEVSAHVSKVPKAEVKTQPISAVAL